MTEGITEAVSRAATAAKQATGQVVKQITRSRTPAQLYPVPRHMQVARFRAHTEEPLQFLYKKHGEEVFNNYVNSVLDLIEEGY